MFRATRSQSRVTSILLLRVNPVCSRPITGFDPLRAHHRCQGSAALRRSTVVGPAGSRGGFDAFGRFQGAAQIPCSQQGGFDVLIVDVIFKEDDDLAARTLPGVTGLHAPCPVPEITAASPAVD